MTSYGDSTGPNSSCAGEPPWTAPMTLGEARQRALAIVDEVYARRAEAAERDPDQAACPECAEKDAEIERLRAVLERIGGPHGCGCWQKCHCDSQAELLIWKEEAKSAANEALTGGTVCEWCGGDGKEHQVDASFSRVPCDWPCFSCGGTGKGGA